jgi:3-hydroxyisobutyrate dehydrogenase-like beta-hydroxyacid dehydrogenase
LSSWPQETVWLQMSSVGASEADELARLAAAHDVVHFDALAETMHLCEFMELDQKEFLALDDGGPLGPPYGLEKLREMTQRDYPAGFPARLAVKDLELVREVADASGVTLLVLDTMLARMSAIAGARGDDVSRWCTSCLLRIDATARLSVGLM